MRSLCVTVLVFLLTVETFGIFYMSEDLDPPIENIEYRHDYCDLLAPAGAAVPISPFK